MTGGGGVTGVTGGGGVTERPDTLEQCGTNGKSDGIWDGK